MRLDFNKLKYFRIIYLVKTFQLFHLLFLGAIQPSISVLLTHLGVLVQGITSEFSP